jgi:protein-tyrosine phosphatase
MSRRVLFVCLGNICRSPTAEAVVRELLRREAPELAVEVDSAGTHDYHRGSPPDPRAIAAARRRGIDMTALRARRVRAADFERFDLVLAMDRENLRQLQSLAPEPYRQRIRLFLEYAPQLERQEVPDPYYGGAAGFEEVLDLAEEAGRGLLAALRARR